MSLVSSASALSITPLKERRVGSIKKERALAQEFPLSAEGTSLSITPLKERRVGS